MKVQFAIDLAWAAPVLRPLGALVRRGCARLIRLHVSQLRPMAPTSMHRFWAQALADLEARR